MNLRLSKSKFPSGLFLIIVLLTSCGSKQKAYEVLSLNGSRETINEKYDMKPNREMNQFVSHYKAKFDEQMKVSVATSDQGMTKGVPESLLTNFSSDQMKRYGDAYTHGNCDLAIMNVNGHRANLPKGIVTLENMYEIYSFDNKLVILKLKGSDLTKVFESCIRIGGAGVSSNVRLVGIGNELKSALVDGKPVDPDKNYTIVSLDYLADGNDGMEDFRKAISIEKTNLTLRDMMIEYVKSQTKQGKTLHSVLDGRIIISNPV
jgi:2',3'-cyclic-nucleotide 2'-phosphodiesterase (5'-nucleotidase family)